MSHVWPVVATCASQLRFPGLLFRPRPADEQFRSIAPIPNLRRFRVLELSAKDVFRPNCLRKRTFLPRPYDRGYVYLAARSFDIFLHTSPESLVPKLQNFHHYTCFRNFLPSPIAALLAAGFLADAVPSHGGSRCGHAHHNRSTSNDDISTV